MKAVRDIIKPGSICACSSVPLPVPVQDHFERVALNSLCKTRIRVCQTRVNLNVDQFHTSNSIKNASTGT